MQQPFVAHCIEANPVAVSDHLLPESFVELASFRTDDLVDDRLQIVDPPLDIELCIHSIRLKFSPNHRTEPAAREPPPGDGRLNNKGSIDIP
jgi:hypothetical protein